MVQLDLDPDPLFWLDKKWVCWSGPWSGAPFCKTNQRCSMIQMMHCKLHQWNGMVYFLSPKWVWAQNKTDIVPFVTGTDSQRNQLSNKLIICSLALKATLKLSLLPSIVS